MVRDSRKSSDVDAVAFQPTGDREEIGVDEPVSLPASPRPLEILGFDDFEAGRHIDRNLALHRLLRGNIVSPAGAARAVP